MKKMIVKVLLFLITLVAVFVIFQTVRQAQAAAQIEREAQDLPVPTGSLGMTTRLEILPLYEEDGDAQKYAVGHGVSYLIRTDQTAILLDVGHNPDQSAESPFLHNLRALGVNWDEIRSIVISHPHPDHIGGMDAWLSQKVSFGSEPVDLSAKLVYVPVNLKGKNLVMALDPQPVMIAPGIATLGVVSFPDAFPFSLRDPKGSEQSLVVNVEGQGLVLITSCGHPTLEKLVTRAETIFDLPVIGVIGGLHYENLTAQEVQPHIDFLSERSPRLVALSPHDSSPDVIEAFRSAFPEEYRYIRVGETIDFP